MRILHLIAYSLYSGPVPSTVGLALAQRAAGHTVWLAHDSKRGGFNDFEEAAAPWLREAGLTAPVPLTLSTKSTPAEIWRDARGLRRFVRQGSADVVHVHMSHDHALAVAATRAMEAPPVVIRSLHAARSLTPRLGQRWLVNQASGLVLRCEEHAQSVRRLLNGRSTILAVIPGAIDSTKFAAPEVEARIEARRRFGLDPEAFVVGHVALIANRGQPELASALARVVELSQRRVQVLYVGRGEGEQALRDQVAALGVGAQVRFAGYLQGADLLTGYAAMDAAFVAQPGNDASARAALEAMGCEVPVLGVQTGALKELITSDKGYPVAGRQPDVIAAAIVEAIVDPHRADRAHAAHVYVQRERSFEREAARTLELYATAMQQKAKEQRKVR